MKTPILNLVVLILAGSFFMAATGCLESNKEEAQPVAEEAVEAPKAEMVEGQTAEDSMDSNEESTEAEEAASSEEG